VCRSRHQITSDRTTRWLAQRQQLLSGIVQSDAAGFEYRLPCSYRPRNPGQLVGQSTGHDTRASSNQESVQPNCKWADLVPSLADAQQIRLAACTVLTRNKADIGSEVGTASILLPVTSPTSLDNHPISPVVMSTRCCKWVTVFGDSGGRPSRKSLNDT
jgi:hypothetical protein